MNGFRQANGVLLKWGIYESVKPFLTFSLQPPPGIEMKKIALDEATSKRRYPPRAWSNDTLRTRC